MVSIQPFATYGGSPREKQHIKNGETPGQRRVWSGEATRERGREQGLGLGFGLRLLLGSSHCLVKPSGTADFKAEVQRRGLGTSTPFAF